MNKPLDEETNSQDSESNEERDVTSILKGIETRLAALERKIDTILINQSSQKPAFQGKSFGGGFKKPFGRFESRGRKFGGGGGRDRDRQGSGGFREGGFRDSGFAPREDRPRHFDRQPRGEGAPREGGTPGPRRERPSQGGAGGGFEGVRKKKLFHRGKGPR